MTGLYSYGRSSSYEDQEGEAEGSEDWVGLSRIKTVIKELRKQYGPMLKRLAD